MYEILESNLSKRYFFLLIYRFLDGLSSSRPTVGVIVLSSWEYFPHVSLLPIWRQPFRYIKTVFLYILTRTYWRSCRVEDPKLLPGWRIWPELNQGAGRSVGDFLRSCIKLSFFQWKQIEEVCPILRMLQPTETWAIYRKREFDKKRLSFFNVFCRRTK